MKPKSTLNCKLFVTTQNGRVANSWKCFYFNQHLLQTICITSEDVQYERGCAVQVRMCSLNQADLQYKQGCEVHSSRSSSLGTGGRDSKMGLLAQTTTFTTFTTFVARQRNR